MKFGHNTVWNICKHPIYFLTNPKQATKVCFKAQIEVRCRLRRNITEINADEKFQNEPSEGHPGMTSYQGIPKKS